VAHTARDTLEVVDVGVLAELAESLPDLLEAASGAATREPPAVGLREGSAVVRGRD